MPVGASQLTGRTRIPPCCAAEAALPLAAAGTTLPLEPGVAPTLELPGGNVSACSDIEMVTSDRSAIPSAEKKSIVSLNESTTPVNLYVPQTKSTTGGAGFWEPLDDPPVWDCIRSATPLVAIRTSVPTCVVSNCKSILNFAEILAEY